MSVVTVVPRRRRRDPHTPARELTPWGAFQMRPGTSGHLAVADAAALRARGTYLSTRPAVPPAIARAAALQACGHALDVADARELLATLGLALEVLR